MSDQMPPRDGPMLAGQWTKITQGDLEKILDGHEKFALKKQGGVRAKLTLYDLSYLDLAGRNLKQAELTGALLCHANLAGAILEEANMFAADMRFADLRHADMTRADLRGACLAGANLSRAIVNDADLRDGVLMRPKDKGGDLMPLIHDEAAGGMEKAVVRGASMERAKFSNSFIVQTDLTDCNLRHAKFVRTNLSLSNLTGCNLEGADFTNANLSGAIFHGAMFSGTILDNSDLTGADLIGAIFDNMDFSKVKLDVAKMPKSLETLDYSLQDIVRDHVKWVGSNGKEGHRASLSKFDLSGQDLAGVNLSAGDLSYAILRAADLSKGEFIMSDMSFTDLRDARLMHADMRGGKAGARQSFGCRPDGGADRRRHRFQPRRRRPLAGQPGSCAPEARPTGRGQSEERGPDRRRLHRRQPAGRGFVGLAVRRRKVHGCRPARRQHEGRRYPGRHGIARGRRLNAAN